MWDCSVFVLAIASILDYAIGDPWGWPHPVRGMGWLISGYTQLIFRLSDNPKILRLAGIILTILLVGGSGLAGRSLVAAANRVHPLLSIAVESILLASCFAGRSLTAAAEDVLQPLTAGDLDKTRKQLSLYVGRDTENLSESEILRAVLETVAENAVDGVTAPLFFAIVGAMIPAGAIVSFPLAYKAASTLDSMVGYRETPFKDLGWFSAKLEDTFTWLPCRLTVITLALLSGKPRYVWRICRRDAIRDPSPNAGWSECAYAAILGVQLGGINYYRGIAKNKPLLADAIHPITASKIYRAMQLTRYCFLIWLLIGSIALAIPMWVELHKHLLAIGLQLKISL